MLNLQECVPEVVDLKKQLFKKMDLFVDDVTILASSTSCIIPSLFTEDLEHRAQCIVAHPVSSLSSSVPLSSRVPPILFVVLLVMYPWLIKESYAPTLALCILFSQLCLICKQLKVQFFFSCRLISITTINCNSFIKYQMNQDCIG